MNRSLQKHPPRNQPPAGGGARPRTPDELDTDARNDADLLLCAASAEAPGTCGARRLAARLAWPPEGIGAPALPPAVRWLSRERWPHCPGPADRMAYLPPGAAGAILYLYRTPDGYLCAVDLEALTAEGNPMPERWRRTCGSKTGGYFAATGKREGRDLLLCEGPVTALALALLYPEAEIRAVGGCGPLARHGLEILRDIAPGSRLVRIMADNDGPGLLAGRKGKALLRRAGHRVRLEWPDAHGDYADWLAANVRAALESDGGNLRDAWDAVLPEAPF